MSIDNKKIFRSKTKLLLNSKEFLIGKIKKWVGTVFLGFVG